MTSTATSTTRGLRKPARTAFSRLVPTVALALSLLGTSAASNAAVFVRNIALATHAQGGSHQVRSNEGAVEVLVFPKFGVTVTSSVPQAAPGQDITFTAVVTSGMAPANPSSPYQLDGRASTEAYLLAPVPAGSVLQATTGVSVYHWAGTPAGELHTGLPSGAGKVDAVGVLLSQVPTSGSANFSFTVRGVNNAQAYNGGTPLQVLPVFNAGAGATVQSSPPPVVRVVGLPPAIWLFSDKAENQPTTGLYLGHPGFMRVDAAACNDDSATAITRTGTVTTTGGDSEQVTLTQLAPHSSSWQVTALLTKRGAAVPNSSVLESETAGTVTLDVAGCYAPVHMDFQLIDPQGTVFDSVTNAPVDRMTVTLVMANGSACTNVPAKVQTWDANGSLIDAPNPYVSQNGGHYEFPLVAAGNYCLAVTATPEFSFPTATDLTKLSSARRLQPGSIGLPFQVGPNPAPVIVDLPVDPINTLSSLFVDKKASQSVVLVGEQVDFTVSVKNTGAKTAGAVVLRDVMSQGLTYVAGTARVNGKQAGEPTQALGALTFALLDLAAGATISVSYRTSVGPFAGNTVRNSASASAARARSNTASVKVDVTRGFETDNKGVLTGTVYLACDKDNVNANLGLPGIKLLLEDGTSVTTDKFGRFSTYGLRSGTHVLKLDSASVPEGAKLLERDARGLAMVDLKDGELFKRNFQFACTPALLEQAKARAALLQQDEAFKVLDRTFTPTATAASAAGTNVTSSSADAAAPAGVLATPGGSTARPVAPTSPVVLGRAPETSKTMVTLENALLAVTDNKPAFLNLQEGQTLPGTTVFVQVKAAVESQLELLVNGIPVSPKQIGQRSIYADKAVMGLEYVGVRLTPGTNILRLVQKDQFNNVRADVKLQVRAPGELAALTVGSATSAPLYAGEGTQTVLRVHSLDSQGLPVTTRLPVTLETDTGRWLLPNGTSAATVDVYVEGGFADVPITQPVQAARVTIKATSGKVQATSVLDFVPNLRPLIGAGLLEGIVRVRSGQALSMMPTTSLDAFSQELKSLSRELGAKGEAGARAAFYLKGKVKGDYLLTLSYDSDKVTHARLFRDISPDEFYPVYGDSSTRSFDAQSSSKLYVRIEKNHNWLLVGDFNTQVTPAKGQRAVLSAYGRPVNGAAGHYESEKVAADGFVMRDATRQKVFEFTPNGTSGPYPLPSAGLLANTERVELLVHDKLNTQAVVKRTTLARFDDYELEPLSGRLLFKGPVSAFDVNQNPQTVRVTYEVESDAAAFTTVGGEVQVQVAPGTTVGARMVHEARPASPYTLQGLLAETQLTATLRLSAELARSMRTGDNEAAGHAGRIEAKGTVGKADIAATGTVSSEKFENTSAGVNPSRRDATATATYPVSDTTKVAAKATYGQDTKTGAVQASAYAGVDVTLAKGVQLEVGVRELRDVPVATAATGPAPVEATTVRAKLSLQLEKLPELTGFVEAEQAVVGTGREVALGATYQLSASTKVYGRHELVNTLPVLSTSVSGRQATAVGVESAYSATGRAYGELRENVNQGATGPAAAYGIKESWLVAKGVVLAGGVERVQALGTLNGATAPTLALTSSVKVNMSEDWRANARAERRISATERSTLLTSGLAYKLSDDWTMLARQAHFESAAAAASKLNVQSRLQLGGAWRSGTDDALAVLESRKEPVDSGEKDSDIVSVQYGRALSTSLRASARIAGRMSRLRTGGQDTRSSASLVGARLSYEVSSKWSLGLQGQMVGARAGPSHGLGLGAEVGYRFTDSLWVVVGYDLMTLRDQVLQGAGPTKGAYLRVRYMFDETALDIEK